LPPSHPEDGPREQSPGCLKRPPGFWTRHPAITAHHLPEMQAGSDRRDAVIRHLCAVREDARSTRGPEQTRLARQCAAADLNVAATRAGGGSCTAELPYLSTLLERCCAVEALNTGNAPEQYGIQNCVAMLEGFNSSPDTLAPFGPFLSAVPAEAEICPPAEKEGVIDRR
jgi:hypothetical protein